MDLKLLKEFLEDIAIHGITEVTETTEYYFIITPSKGPYDEMMWEVNKKTKEIFHVTYAYYVCEHIDTATEISLEEFKRAMKSSPLEF